jgi:NADP-dependent 3-hydroxy acid dehydrogenase YdfG
MSQNVEGKVVVITGASSGLGEATAKILSAQGATVVLGARRHDRIQALAKELTSSGGKAQAVSTDVADRQQVKNLVDAAVEAYGRVDVMINNAGLMPQALLERLQVDEWERMIDVNLKGVLYGIAAALPIMQQGLRQEVKPYNIRATVISPGAVATELPDSVTDPDAADRIRKFYAASAIPADSFARTVAFAISQPDEVDINEIVFRPTAQEY